MGLNARPFNSMTDEAGQEHSRLCILHCSPVKLYSAVLHFAKLSSHVWTSHRVMCCVIRQDAMSKGILPLPHDSWSSMLLLWDAQTMNCLTSLAQELCIQSL
jgi:hypothetical protein